MTRRIAVCFIGRIKTWEYNLINIIETIKNSFQEDLIDFFASVHGDPRDQYVIDFMNTLKPVFCNAEKVERVPRESLVKEKLCSALFHKWKVIQLVERKNVHYDWVFIFRCDFTKTNIINLPDEFPLENVLYVPNPDANPVNVTNRTPDHINAGSLETMKTFSEFYLSVDEYIDREGTNEKILYEYITAKGLTMKEFYWWNELDHRRGGWDSNFYD